MSEKRYKLRGKIKIIIITIFVNENMCIGNVYIVVM